MVGRSIFLLCRPLLILCLSHLLLDSTLGTPWVTELANDLARVLVILLITIKTWAAYIIVRSRKYKNNHRKVNSQRYYVRGTKRNSYRIASRRKAVSRTWLRLNASNVKPNNNKSNTNSHLQPFDSDSYNIAIDNCASANFTNDLNDYINKRTTKAVVQGIGSKQLSTVGTVEWKIQDDSGKTHTFTIPNVYYAPELPWRLLSPQVLAQVLNDNQGTGCLTLGQRMELFWHKHKYKKTIPLSDSNIAILRSAPSNHRFFAYASTIATPPIGPHAIPFEDHEVEPSVQAIPSDRQEGNNTTVQRINDDDTTQSQVTSQSTQYCQPIPFTFHDTNEQTNRDDNSNSDLTTKQWELLRLHYRLGHISMYRIRSMAKMRLLPKYLADTPPPMCASCQFGKATKRPWRTKAIPSQAINLKPITQPGSCVSVDQLESPVPGFIAQLKGRLTTQRYKVATIFVDHFSRYGYVHLQTSTSAKETIQAKEAFEAHCQKLGVGVKHYHADNGRFADNDWLAHVARNRQTISFCGVGAHFQNGVAEKRIRDLQENARTMMLQAELKWKRAHSATLWPYAVRNANDIMNSTPRTDHNPQSPIEIMSGSAIRPKLPTFHQFGCPVYVLSTPLQGNKSVGKWNERARIGIYLGQSPKHARTVSLVLNPRTGLVSPQWHVKHDDMFETVSSASNDRTHGMWKKLAGFETTKETKKLEKRVLKLTNQQPDEIVPLQEVEADMAYEGAEATEDEIMPVNEGETEESETPTTEGQQASTRRSSRRWKPTAKLLESLQQQEVALPSHLEVLAEQYDMREDEFELDDPFAFAAKHSDPDSFYYHQAMKQEDAPQFRKAMQKEIDDHTNRGNWQLIERIAVPVGMKVLDAVWAMKRKRKIISQAIYKWKARINLHGGQQIKGIHFWETFAPVVQWATIRLVLILALIMKWHTRQIDFVLAFPQAPAETDLYMEIPKGVHVAGIPEGKQQRDYVLKLNKNLYGGCAASRVWNKYLHKGLVEIGFQQSKVDECLYYRNHTIFMVYVDDGILAGPSVEEIDEVIQMIGQRYDITDEGDLTDYLGVHVTTQEDGTIHLTQPHLIQQIIDDVNFQKNTKVKETPAESTKVLNKDETGKAHKASWGYRSVIGKLNFLERSTRGELGYAVHQCARFSQEPKESHTNAVHRIVRYLMHTKEKGIILSPTEQAFECFADADFGGLWDKERAETDPTTGRSRTGYLIRFAGCPIVWASKLQTEFALSSTEAEYIALSTALRQVIPLMELFKEIKWFGIIDKEYVPKVYCKAFEDNSGALELARTPKMRPRTKHINCKYHHFRSYVAKGEIEVHSIKTTDQLADLWTKPLGTELFRKFTKATMGFEIPKLSNNNGHEGMRDEGV